MDKEPGQSEKNDTLATMASGITHELNNILYPILIYANLLLKKTEVGSDDHADLSEIVDCARRGQNLVTQIRIFTGRVESTKEVFDLVSIISKAMVSIRATGPATVTFEERLYNDKLPVLCDASQVSQMLTNICSNAVQAIEDVGEIKISLESITLDDFRTFDRTILTGEHARLVVTDNGVGMHPATLEKIFDPFFTTQHGAKGLGLSAVIGLVRSHGGGISASSKPDVGTTIELFLPLVESTVEELSE